MYQTKYIHYKSIFKNGEQSETVEYKKKGIVYTDDNTHISFESEDGVIEIIFDHNEILLKNGASLLRFQKEKELWNEYQLPYGSTSLKTKLLLFEPSEERVKMKYEIHDHGGLISVVYLLVHIRPYMLTEEL